jgi:hypothetical protein
MKENCNKMQGAGDTCSHTAARYVCGNEIRNLIFLQGLLFTTDFGKAGKTQAALKTRGLGVDTAYINISNFDQTP